VSPLPFVEFPRLQNCVAFFRIVFRSQNVIIGKHSRLYLFSLGYKTAQRPGGD
jgi:hypothetical protein